MESQEKPSTATLREYYDNLPKEYGYASQCKMTLLGDIAGKRVLDIDCRRGKGVIKLSDYVGPKGKAVGVDPSQEWIDIANSYMDGAWRKNGLLENNMEYRVAFPEDLEAAGFAEGTFDLVFCNSSIVLDYDPMLVLCQIFRVLRPGGVLIYDGVIADTKRDKNVVAQAKEMGNAVQAAFSMGAFEAMVAKTGFEAPEYYEKSIVKPDVGYVNDYSVPTVESEESVRFIKTTARIYKPF